MIIFRPYFKKIFLRFIGFLFGLFSVCCVSVAVQAYDLEPYPFQKKIDTERFFYLTREIRCVVCQSQSIADSNAPLAKDLRAKIYQLIKDKKSNDEIKDYLVKRYGEFILLQPRFNKLTLFLWVFPFLSTFLAAGFIYRIGRK